MREFVFTWYKNVKVGKPIIRKNSIKVIEEDFATAAHKATNLFCSQFGNLKKNTIVQIQEMQKKKKRYLDIGLEILKMIHICKKLNRDIRKKTIR